MKSPQASMRAAEITVADGNEMQRPGMAGPPNGVGGENPADEASRTGSTKETTGSQLDTASNGFFLGRTEADALELVENMAKSDSVYSGEHDRSN
ncbi:hypothetical protein F2Q69_00024435 [Brassica cretica]|uniref:Uncharacterized protein n=1 Tax=Brassica cretica TaxID=69181 RepID=A0A8S9QA03_BRACR|nr:hypothetical protein F2Q69_00024435 [Brassica cretica]